MIVKLRETKLSFFNIQNSIYFQNISIQLQIKQGTHFLKIKELYLAEYKT